MMQCGYVLTCILFTRVIKLVSSYLFVEGNLQSERQMAVKNKSTLRGEEMAREHNL